LVMFAFMVSSVRRTHASSIFFRKIANTQSYTPEQSQIIGDQLKTKFATYEGIIRNDHLDHGMVVGRDSENNIVDECDSLLFSSLRFVALDKAGESKGAKDAWTAIRASRSSDGFFIRHPRCNQPASRDMILGVLLALTQHPPGWQSIVAEMVSSATANFGFFADGPIYVSYMSPGLAALFRHLAIDAGISEAALPTWLNESFSTLEIDAPSSAAGYESHLVALTLWVEMELSHSKNSRVVRSPEFHFGPLQRLFAAKSLRDHRREWLADQLLEADRSNLFFRYLRLETADAISADMRTRLAEELLKMPQFPNDRLPGDCDRRADYLWQRHSREYQPQKTVCTQSFSGVDFLWMAALLWPETHSENATRR